MLWFKSRDVRGQGYADVVVNFTDGVAEDTRIADARLMMGPMFG